MFEIKLLRKTRQSVLEVRQVDCRQSLGVDSRPHDMGMPSPLFFVDHDCPRLTLQPEGLARLIRRPLKILFPSNGILGRIEAQ
jgi:hypothetical protein